VWYSQVFQVVCVGVLCDVVNMSEVWDGFMGFHAVVVTDYAKEMEMYQLAKIGVF